jgi:hypothetical protein
MEHAKAALPTPPGARRKMPPCKRIIEYREPHSPFQKLINNRRLEIDARHGLSVRELARRIGSYQSTLWIWLHNKAGYPSPRSFKPEHLAGLARELHLTPEAIQQSIDDSRRIYTPTQAPNPPIHPTHSRASSTSSNTTDAPTSNYPMSSTSPAPSTTAARPSRIAASLRRPAIWAPALAILILAALAWLWARPAPPAEYILRRQLSLIDAGKWHSIPAGSIVHIYREEDLHGFRWATATLRDGSRVSGKTIVFPGDLRSTAGLVRELPRPK